MSDGFKQVGEGYSVFETDDVVEGPVRWLDSPQAVIDFVGSGAVGDTIVVARGGTTTFLTPALTAGVKGIVTLQGHPESHLGILSREYGIPCLMGVQFTEGVRSDRGEVIPADGARLRLQLDGPRGHALVEPGAPVADEPIAAPDEAAAAQAEQVALLLEKFLGTVPHGSEGDEQLRATLTTDVLQLSDESVRRELTAPEVNDLHAYMAWNLWDFLALRATEGESGLIPRQEYECFGCVQQWQRYPDFYRLITETVGVDGLIDLGATSRREPGSKANMLHIWCTGFTPLFGRAILDDLGVMDAGARAQDVRELLQFMRRLYKGYWGDGPMFTSMRGYVAPQLDASWVQRFADEVEVLDDDARRTFTAFNAGTELMGFLLHFDNRSGLADSGPYPLPGGRFMIVRDHFLHDPAYHWHDVAEGLPHCFTQAMVFNPSAPLETALMDGATLFTKPASYLRHLESVAVYARDTWDTPASQMRRVDTDEMARVVTTCQDASARLYRRIASMPKRDKIVAGAQVYYTEFVLPFARLAGVWDTMVDELDFHELDPVAAQAYYPLVTEGRGAEMVGRMFLTGTGFPPLPEGAFAEVPFDVLHALCVQGSVAALDGDGTPLAEAGLAIETAAGWMPTESGRARHAALLEAERTALDLDALGAVYERFLAANGPFKALNARWQTASEDDRFALVGELASCVERVEPALGRTADAVPRFASYGPRLRAALERVEAGEHDWVASPRVDSLHTVWMQVHEDYLLTLGRSREAEGSF